MARISRIQFTNDELKRIWDGMYSEPVITASVATCNENDETCLKISMLLKTAYYLHKNHFHKMKLKLDVANTEIAEKDDVILQLRKEITRLKSAERHEETAVSNENDYDKKSPTILKRLSGENKYLQNAFESATKKVKVDVEAVTPTKSAAVEILVPETVEYDLDDSPFAFAVKKVKVAVESVTPTKSVEILVPETVEYDLDDLPFTTAVKKVKVDVEAVTPTKSAAVKILVPETVEYDLDDSPTVFNQGIIIPETVDMSMDEFPELEDLELDERCSTPSKQDASLPNPKSPVILTARTKKHSSLQVSSSCLDLSVNKLSPDKPLKCESKAVNQLHSPSPKKLQPNPSEPSSPLMSSCRQPQFDINQNSPSKSPSSVLKGQRSSACSVKKNFGKENKIEPKTDLGFKPSTSNKQHHMTPTTAKVKNSKGISELEVRPTPKNFKAPKLRQTKLSLSMFKAKKTNVPQIDENQQLQMAIEDSVKTAKQQDVEKMVISPSPDRLQSKKLSVDSNKTYFEGATALSFDNVDTTPQRQSVDLDKTYFEDAKSLQCENESPMQQTHDPDRTYFEDMKPTQQADEMTIKVPHSSDLDKTYFEEARSILYGLVNNPMKPDIKQPPKLESKDVPGLSNLECLPVADKNYIQNYDRVPENPKEDNGYVYQAGPVRKKDDRQKLPGWECHECKVFFETYCKNMNTQERQQVVGHCSRHRQALPFISNTPPGIWEIGEIQSPVGVTQDGKLYREPKKAKTWLIDNAVPMPPSLEPNML